jgi:hypothetical protein
MTNTPRRLARSAALAGVLTLCAAGTAHADITGTVATTAGYPVAGASIDVTAADGSFASFKIADANGAFRVTTTDLSGDPGPYTIKASYSDPCNDFGATDPTFTAPPVADNVVQNITLDAFPFCASSFPPSGSPDATGNPWPEKGQILSGPGGITYLRVLAPSSATAFTLSLNDGTVVGSGEGYSLLTLTAPQTPYNGPLTLSYTSDGAPISRTVATLVSGPVGKVTPPSGVSDLAAIVDVSGSMSGNDPTNRRRDAVSLLVDLAGQGDRLVGTGFDDGFRELFPRTTIAGNSTKASLKAAARKKIGNFGGTDYNVAFANAFTALSADPLNPTVPKSAIFLTDGAHGGSYDNSHLRFAYNGTGSPWPVCVVQLGKGFQASDTVRLKRIAADTGGTYAKAPNNAQLEDLYFQCRGKSSGATTLLKKTNTFRIGQARTYSRKVAKNQRSATFFVSWGVGKYRIQLVQPGGRVFNRSVGKTVRFVSGKTSSFFQVQKPKTGLWRVRVVRLKTGAPTDRATTTVTVQKRR